MSGNAPANSIVTQDWIAKPDNQDGSYPNEVRLAAISCRLTSIFDLKDLRSSSHLAVLLEYLDRIPRRIVDCDFQWHSAGERMGSATEAWVVCPKSHLDHVE